MKAPPSTASTDTDTHAHSRKYTLQHRGPNSHNHQAPAFFKDCVMKNWYYTVYLLLSVPMQIILLSPHWTDFNTPILLMSLIYTDISASWHHDVLLAVTQMTLWPSLSKPTHTHNALECCLVQNDSLYTSFLSKDVHLFFQFWMPAHLNDFDDNIKSVSVGGKPYWAKRSLFPPWLTLYKP